MTEQEFHTYQEQSFEQVVLKLGCPVLHVYSIHQARCIIKMVIYTKFGVYLCIKLCT
jgi:hypothetical protein